MRVTFELQGYLSWYAPNKVTELTVEVPPGSTILQAIRLAGLPYGEVAFVAIGREQKELDDLVADGQRITLIPPISGG